MLGYAYRLKLYELLEAMAEYLVESAARQQCLLLLSRKVWKEILIVLLGCWRRLWFGLWFVLDFVLLFVLLFALLGMQLLSRRYMLILLRGIAMALQLGM